MHYEPNMYQNLGLNWGENGGLEIVPAFREKPAILPNLPTWVEVE